MCARFLVFYHIICACQELIRWMYTKKVDKCDKIEDKERKEKMSNKKSPTKYSEELKKQS